VSQVEIASSKKQLHRILHRATLRGVSNENVCRSMSWISLIETAINAGF